MPIPPSDPVAIIPLCPPGQPVPIKPDTTVESLAIADAVETAVTRACQRFRELSPSTVATVRVSRVDTAVILQIEPE